MSSLVNVFALGMTSSACMGASALAGYGAIKSAKLGYKQWALIQMAGAIFCAGLSGAGIVEAVRRDCPKPAAPSAQGAVMRIPGEIPQVTAPLPVQKERAPAVML